MRVLHTADWHIGQLFHEYDRSYEHQQFLDWLVQTIKVYDVEVLLISGDVFDLANPSAAAIKMFYSFLNQAVRVQPELQMVITAGNHDSASRLEAPKPLLESSNIHIVGVVEKDAEGNIDYRKLTIPLKDKEGRVAAWCLAVPFLRMGDYPAVSDCDNPYAEGVERFYKEAYQQALEVKEDGQALIAMGHLHAQKAEVSDMDKQERLIMGGVECISAGAFAEEIRYVALGHIHKAQCIGGKEHIRYCGSPIPMSFSEIHYKHQVMLFDLAAEGISKLQAVEVPLSVALQRVPSVHSALPEVLMALQQLPDAASGSGEPPYLEVRVRIEGPEPGLRHKIETALSGKHVRLARIDARTPAEERGIAESKVISADKLHDLQPLDVFRKVYQQKYNNEAPQEMIQLFNQVSQAASQAD
ncbi:exonuclease SbcCD subunit D C-terminal domain-containing protein [Arcticibacter sp. MXS-1]|uniref:exonuclease SbcCD subunit D C-terminal domain-containing protein n=1 Tax=Arcticibacter sp. MXS-1 TaxID=3341726 RepID=UPI0035A882F8